MNLPNDRSKCQWLATLRLVISMLIGYRVKSKSMKFTTRNDANHDSKPSEKERASARLYFYLVPHENISCIEDVVK